MVFCLGYGKIRFMYIIKDEDSLTFILSEKPFRNYRIMEMALFTLKTITTEIVKVNHVYYFSTTIEEILSI